MKNKSIVLSILAIVAFAGTSFAQQVPTYSQMPMGNSYPGYYPSYPSYPTTAYPTNVYPSYPAYPNYPAANVYPSYPMAVTPNQVTGVNPWTGGLNTANQQINNTVFAPGRNPSLGNGSGRWVNRPVFGNNGQVVGQQQGYVWNNSLTGQEHGEVNTLTPNGLGGVNNTATSYMTNGARPATGRPNTNRPMINRPKPAIRVPSNTMNSK